jgi:hypothetical protein
MFCYAFVICKTGYVVHRFSFLRQWNILLANDNTIEFIAMNGCTDKKRGSIAFTPFDMNRDRDFGVGVYMAVI